jgi:acyl-CoA thioester hydrolase
VCRDVLRFRDTDRLGHVNNAVFATFLETGRTWLLYDPQRRVGADGCDYVIARLELDFLAELNWPGEVAIGTGVKRIGRSSMTLLQVVSDGARPVARGETVIVQIDRESRRAAPLSEATRAGLERFALPPAQDTGART